MSQTAPTALRAGFTQNPFIASAATLFMNQQSQECTYRPQAGVTQNPFIVSAATISD